MTTMVIEFDNGNMAVKQILEGLSKIGAIVIRKSRYNQDFIEKVQRGDRDLMAGKGTKIDTSELWK